MFRFTVPPGAYAGQKVRVQTPNGQQVDVVIPQGVGPGQQVQIKLPGPSVPSYTNYSTNQAPPSQPSYTNYSTNYAPQSQPSYSKYSSNQPSAPSYQNHALSNQRRDPPPDSKIMKLTVPRDIMGGQNMTITTPSGNQMTARLPIMETPGSTVYFDTESGRFVSSEAYYDQAPSADTQPNPTPRQQNANRIMQIRVPHNVTGGQEIMVQVPSGQQIRVKLPVLTLPGDIIKLDTVTGELLDNSTIPDDIPMAVPEEEERDWTADMLLNKGDPFPSWFTFQPFMPPKIGMGLKEAKVGLPPPVSSGRKKALLIGINYKGTKAALNGCVNDVFAMKAFLETKGFKNTAETMVCLIDSVTDARFVPTKANIIKGMKWLIAGASPGDTLFFHYSGHGAQQTDPTGHERDGLNETIVPMDFERQGVGMITDDEIWDFVVARVPNGCRLYSLMDCCHCGTGMDLSFNWKNHSTWIEEPNPSYTQGDVILFSGCDDHQTSADAYNKLAQAAGGAMTTSFISCATRNPGQSIAQFIHAVHSDVKRRGFSQVPQLSSSQRWDADKRVLDFSGGIVSNSNPHYGKLVRQRFQPQKPDMGNSPLGPMLLGAGFAVLVAPELLGGLGRMLGGLGDGGGFDFGFGDLF